MRAVSADSAYDRACQSGLSMDILRDIWDFIQSQLLGMRWLNSLVGQGLIRLGIDPASRAGGMLQFFVYDTIKILALLSLLIFIIACIQSYFPPERSRRILGRFQGLPAFIIAALLGTVTPFCSCSSIPLFIGFSSAGLPVGVTFSFLISSPMVDLGSLVLLTGIFGAPVAVIYVLIGLVIAVAGGAFLQKAGMQRYVEDFILNTRVPLLDSPELTARDRLRWAREQMLDTLRKVGPYVLAGVGIGAVIHNLIPQQWIESVLGGRNPFAVLLAVLSGIPIYADIFGTVPVAESLLVKGAGLGTVLAFMMAVTTLSLPSLIMLRKAVKPRLLGAFVAIIALGIIATGYLFNFLQPVLP